MQRHYGLLGTGSPGQPPRFSHSSRALLPCISVRVLLPVRFDGVLGQFPCQGVVFAGAAAGLAREHIPRGAGKVGHARHVACAFQSVDHLEINEENKPCVSPEHSSF